MRILTLLLSGLMCSGGLSAATPAWTPSRMMHELLGPLYPQRAMFLGGNAAVAAGGIAIVNSNNCVGGTTGGTTSAVDTTSANTIFLATAAPWSSISPRTVFDSKSNTWIPLIETNGSSPPTTIIYYCKACTVGTGHTFTVAGASTFASVCEVSASGLTSNPFDTQNPSGDAFSGVTITRPNHTSPVTPAANNSIWITGASTISANITGVNLSFVQAGTKQFVGSTNYGVSIAYLIQGTAASLDPTWTNDSAQVFSSQIAVFK